ncbi:MAG: hypothetical protein WCR27_09155 [Eubacteriales bacterium]
MSQKVLLNNAHNGMKKILIILLLYYPISTYAQGLSFEYAVGYGTYQLYDIRNFQESMINRYGLQQTDCFPNYITHSLAVGYIIKNHHFGSNYSFFTTGGRLHRADYSGSYTVDMIMNGNRVGGFYKYYVNTGLSPLDLYFQFSSGIMISSLKMKEQMVIYSESIEQTMNLKGVGLYLEPTAGITYRLTNWLHFSLGGGYEFDLLGRLKLSGRPTQLMAHWNGLRLYGGIILTINN